MRKNRLYIAGSILLIILVAGGYAYREYNRKPAALNDLAADVTVSAEVLLRDYESNEESANKKYLGKVLDVTGPVTGITAEDTIANIQLGKKDAIAHISCSMSAAAIQESKLLSEGKTATVRGICTGYLMDVELNRCVIIK